MQWGPLLADSLGAIAAQDPGWQHRLTDILTTSKTPRAIHLAIFVEPYLTYFLDGRKTVESRFSVHRCAPYRCIEKGDVVLLKRSGGPVVGICQVSHAWFYRLDPKTWSNIKAEFTEALCAQDPQFWIERQRASFATLMQVEHLRSIDPIKWPKEDQRGWVVLRARSQQLALEL